MSQKDYQKEYYKRMMESPEFRKKRVEQTAKYKQKKKREEYEKAIEFFRDMLAGGEPASLLVDRVMARYKITERKGDGNN